MDKLVMLAVAGAGKTYHICNTIDPNKRNLILAYTHENIHNIRNELISNHGMIPDLTSVMTFDSFVYRYFICPYEPTIAEHFGCFDFRSDGITTVDPPTKTIQCKGREVPNPKYNSKDTINHYLTCGNQYYCSTLSELVMYVKKGKESLIKRASGRLNLFFDQILIDEFQDFREYDYELIVTLSKMLNNVLLVGDYFQHSVSAINNSGKPFKKMKKYVSYYDFVAELKKMGFDVDDKTLGKSRRCSKNICTYVNDKLSINIESSCINEGEIEWIDGERLVGILQNPFIIKLVFSKAESYSFNAMNWSYSKGDTFKEVCVILTDNFENLDRDDFNINDISDITKNKLYVAMTRSSGNLYLVKWSTFKKYKKLFTYED